ncbi:MAG TPA: TniQ family protein [Mycobacterium sp.]|uniref:TniQ family protein n=1 Tax=Mycobacterium sp. TaxID=1785 RepID=UPI002BDB5DDF|nr:TniQ family protein [Mycobacterium sp.]HME76950.1 TniQ family protein [Mycobacterium sp.]
MRVEPMPGEALESWLAAYATRMNATWGEVLDAVLPVGADGIASTHRGAVLTTGLTDEERESISAATEVDAADLDAMTLMGHYASPMMTTDARTGRARTPWGLAYRQRFCPLCMKAAPGRRMLEWFLPWIATCIEHRCFLVDSCPQCAQLQLATDWLSRRLYPHPDRCSRLVKGEPHNRRCTARLSRAHPDKLRPGHPVLTMQQTLTELLAEEKVDAGVYRVAPVTAEQLLIDVRVLGNWIVRAPNLTDLIELFGGRATDHEIGLWRRRLHAQANTAQTYDKNQDVASATRVALAAPAAWVGTGVAAALTVLMQPSPDDAARAFRAATSSAPAREIRYRSRVSGLTHSTAVTAVDLKARAADFTVIEQLRYRTVTHLPRLPDTRRFATKHAMLHAVPTLFWPEWAFRLDTEDLPWGTARQVMSRLLLTIGCVMSTPELERHLHSTVDAQRIAQAANNFRAHPNWEGIITALLRLHEHLQAHKPPIDYQRRRTLNYDHLLSEQQWTHLVAEEGLRTSPTSAAAARLWLIEQLSGAPVPNTQQALPCRGVCTDRMRTTLTPQLARALNAVSADYLRKRGVSGEPLTWVPPLTLLDGLNLPGRPPETIEPNSIHKLLDAGLTVTALAHRLDASVWKVRYQLEHHPIPSGAIRTRSPKRIKGRRRIGAHERVRALLPEQKLRDLHEHRGLTFTQIAARLELPLSLGYLARVISHLAIEYGIHHRRQPLAELITADWLHQRHVVELRTLGEMADEIGVSDSTIGTWARKFGIPVHHWKRRPPLDPRVIRLVEALFTEPGDVPAGMQTTAAWVRIQRFAVIASYANFTRAAQALGCRKERLSAQIGRLEADLGHTLVERAVSRHHSMTLTSFGEELAQATRRSMARDLRDAQEEDVAER